MERYAGHALGLRVSEGGHGELRTEAEADAPHLVSMGSGRLSTGVTLHPLPANKGRIAVGSGAHCDIPVHGTGVEDTHCFMENTGNVVTLHPVADMTFIDGRKVSEPTRLSQGSMLCIGRSNYLRFNHPAEARLMKTMLPFTRISMAPLSFATGDKESLDAFQLAIRAVDSLERKSAPVRGHSSPYGTGSDGNHVDNISANLQSCVLGKISIFESLASQGRRKTPSPAVISPKVFPPGSATVNAPACDVLGPVRAAKRLAGVPHELSQNRSTCNGIPQNKCHQIAEGMPSADYWTGLPNSRSKPPQDFMSQSVVGLPGNPLGKGNTMYYEDLSSSGGRHHSSSSKSKTPLREDLMSSSMVVGNFQDYDDFHQPPNTFHSTPLSYTNTVPFNGHQYNDKHILGGQQFQEPTHNGGGFYQSPSRNQNSSPLHKSLGSSPSNKPVSSVSSGGSGGRRTPVSLTETIFTSNLRQKFGSPNASLSGSTCSLEELAVRGNEMDLKRKLAVVERMMEQEVERAERARLDDILSMCADYERQVQKERTPKHQQKSTGIKTNGSLPRDKRNVGSLSPGLSPPRTSSSTDDIHQIFTFDTSTSLHSSPSHRKPCGGVHHNYENVMLVQSNGSQHVIMEGSENIPYASQPNTYYNGGSTSPVPDGFQPYESSAHPGSPRTRIKTVASAKEPLSLPRDITHEVLESQAGKGNLNTHFPNASFGTPNPQHSRMCTSTPTDNVKVRDSPEFHGSPLLQTQVVGNSVNAQADVHCTSKLSCHQNLDKRKFILPLDEPFSSQGAKNTTESSFLKFPKQHNGDQSGKSAKEKDCERDSGIPASPTQEVAEKSSSTNGKIHCIEIEVLQKEKSKIMSAMTVLKGKVTDIEQQEEELEREMEMEQALIEAELHAQTEKLRIEEGRLISLRERVAQLDADMAECQAREAMRQATCREKLEIAERKADILQVELRDVDEYDDMRRIDLEERLRQQQDVVDTERKLFEDLEFRQLEEEAGWLAGREELQRELTEAAARVAARVGRVDQLRAQAQSIPSTHSSNQESLTLQEQRLAYIRRLEQGRQRLNELDVRLEELGVQGLSSHDVSSETDEEKPGLIRKASQDDLDRISKVTSGAPLDISDTGSVGRKTLESLKEIERNRQLHLVQQGSMVIEQERRRVQQLKRRVQDEVRAQWEEKKREMNCSSLLSVASEDGSLTSSDFLTESASGDDARVGPGGGGNSLATAHVAENTSGADLSATNIVDGEQSSEQQMVAEQQAHRDRLLEETRPLSDASSYDDHLSGPMPVRVRDRDKSSRLQQRPLTRYLPIRGEALDLRQHIESAGHQIELCPHVILDHVSCRGVLHKMASKFHSWQKRWFVFDRSQRTLAYYSNRNEGKPRGGVYFQSIEEVYVDHLNSVKSPQPQLTFVVKTRERTYHLMAPSAEALRIWVDVVFTGAEGYQEFEHGS